VVRPILVAISKRESFPAIPSPANSEAPLERWDRFGVESTLPVRHVTGRKPTRPRLAALAWAGPFFIRPGAVPSA
jgi:hypothetical protein